MKKMILLCTIVASLLSLNAQAQKSDAKKNAKKNAREQHGRNLNIGIGLGYYGYIGHTVPVVMVNYEFDVARNFTLAPFIGYYSHTNSYCWGNPNNPYHYYNYRETVIPIGIKGAYYFDELFNANPHWDFYAAASLGFQVRTEVWDNGYAGDRSIARGASPVYADLHAGARYHFNKGIGMFLDLSTGVSTLGLSFKL